MPSKKLNTLQKIGLKVRQAREEASLTQQQLAELLGYKDRISISFIENGHKSPYKNIEKIAKITGKPLSWFFEEDEEKKMLHWKASQYDYWRKQLEQIFSLSPNKSYTDMTEEELEQELGRLGIFDPKLKAIYKAIPVLSDEEKEKLFQHICRQNGGNNI
jgi:transcriptional regulator with XRE-family HTH domain